jgi:large repetitive protein
MHGKRWILALTALLLGTFVTANANASDGDASPARSPEPSAQQEEYAGYLFTYFTGEGTENGEQVYFALSEGNDPLHWQELNGGAPVLTSNVGEQGVRDPFIIRSPEGDRFYMIATDLRIYGNGDWDGAQRHGSRSIVVWESTDLVDWGEPRLVEVSPETAGNTWAPEAYYDEELGAYVVFWASKLYAEDDPDHTGDTYNRMMYATTRDFVTFSEPEVWNDPGYSVIDSTVIQQDDGTYQRFTKDERDAGTDAPCGKFITQESSDSLTGTSFDLVADCLGSGTISQGEGPLVFKSNTEEKWYLFIDEFGGRGYVPFETTDLASGQWTPSSDYTLPANPRHGTVLPVTQEEYDRLAATYGAQ